MKFKIEKHKLVSSTNALALRQTEEGAAEGLVLVADYQEKGRGKLGRKWVSPPGKNLLFSLLIRPPIRAHRAPLLTQTACRSVAQVLKRDYGIGSTFKRPNDVMVEGKKICGVLIEASSGSNGHLHGAVIGVGLNVNADSKDLVPEAISMREITKKAHSRTKILRQLLTQLGKDLRPFYAHSA